MNRQRFIPLIFIVAAHLLLLQLFVGFHVRVVRPEVIAPVEIYSAPEISKLTAKPTKKVTPKVMKPRVPVPDPIVLPETVSPIAENPVSVASGPEKELSAPVLPEPPAPVPESPPPPPAPKTLVTLPPPSASYLLQVVRTEPNVANPYYGAGEIRWEHDENSYHMHLEVGVDLLFATIRLYNMDSEGSLGDTGIKPKTMTETRRGRSATATHFNYDTHSISFSASTAVIAMTDGAQDRATIMMQLASIGNADPSQFQAGKEITIQVAEDKDAPAFQFVVVGQETIDTKLGQIDTWHIVRPPRPGVYSARLDIWVAPELNWLPIQIRNTEVNWAITTQTIRKIITESK